tara:strand:+ start:7987 stop:8619 length:633 start_codon:yes stop_codon:yes gene_type:complete
MIGTVFDWKQGGYGKILYEADGKEEEIHVHYKNVEGHDVQKITAWIIENKKVSFEIGKGHYNRDTLRQYQKQAINVKILDADGDKENDDLDEESDARTEEISESVIQRVLQSPVILPTTPPPSSPVLNERIDDKLHQQLMNIQISEYKKDIETLQEENKRIVKELSEYKKMTEALQEENNIIKRSLQEIKSNMALLISNMELVNKKASSC